ncbi:putative Kinase A anchor protein [Seiridium cardinale]|uniref:Kinase A anchor protein n=1 Tax=Seiridium cardinale TaxID=138064 RepID=A0ABR2XYD2_9PEZI
MPAKPFPTHFLCIPLVSASSRPQLNASVAAFCADVTSPDSFAVPAGAIRPVGTLHLTLGVMSFPKNEGVEKAVELLKTLIPRKILAESKPAEPASTHSSLEGQEPRGPPPSLLSVTLKGLQSMQSASRATTLYASPVDPDGMLQSFCEKIKQAFEEAEIMVNDKRPLLLHATIVNTIYIKGRRQGKKREKITIDARGILDRYDDYVWMEDIPVEKIAICRMGAKESEDGHDQEYEVEAEIEVGSPG